MPQGKHKFDHVPVDPKREYVQPIRDGLPVGTIRSVVPGAQETVDIACEKCGKIDARTLWQSQNAFYCYECGHITRMDYAEKEMQA